MSAEHGLESFPQSLFHQLLEETSIGIVIMKAIFDGNGMVVDFEFQFVNKAGKEILRRQDLLGKKVLEEFPMHKENGLFETYVAVFKTQTSDAKEIFTGDPYQAWGKLAIIPTEIGISVQFEDITESKQRQQKEEQETSLLRDFIENLPAGAMHRLGETVTLNKKAKEMLGYSQEEIKDVDTWFRLVHREHWEQARALYEKERARGFKGIGEVPIWTKKGEFLRIRFTANTYSNGEVWLMQDITNETEAEFSLHKSNSILQAVIDNANDGILILDNAGSIESMNPSACRLFGYEEKEISGQPLEVLMADAFQKQHISLLSKEWENQERKKTLIEQEGEGKRKDGSTFPCHCSMSEIQVEEAKMFSVIIRDLTQRKEAEEVLRKHSKKLEQEVKKRTESLRIAKEKLAQYAKQLETAQWISKVGSWEWNLQTNLVVWSDELFRIMDLEKSSNKVSVEKFFEFVHPDDLEFVKEISEKAAKEKKGLAAKYRIITAKGEEKHVYATGGYDVRNESGEVIKLFGIVQDITDLKKTELALAKSLEKEKELNEMKSRFVSTASHEFRTPLATILTSTSLVERYEKPEHAPKRAKHINRIKSNVQNMRNILDDFLSLSKLEEGNIRASLEAIDLPTFFGELVEQLQDQAKPGQQMSFEYDGEIKAVQLDPKLLWNICVNLLSNAIKYSGEGQEIHIRCIQTPEEVQIQVIDHGIGIPLEDQKHMFTRFFRAQNASNIKGTGLGLTIVQKYVELMNGKIEFKSEPGKQTVFTLHFPQSSR